MHVCVCVCVRARACTHIEVCAYAKRGAERDKKETEWEGRRERGVR